MTITPPEQLKYGKVVGQFLLSQADTVADPDRHPDLKPASSLRVTFSPRQRVRRVVNGQSVTVLSNVYTATVDSEGFVLDEAGARGIWLTTGVYDVRYSGLNGYSNPPSHTIEVTEAHTDASPLDLTKVGPYTPSPLAPTSVISVVGSPAEGQVIGHVNGVNRWLTPMGPGVIDPDLIESMQQTLDDYQVGQDATDTGVASAIATGPQTTAILESTYAAVDAPLSPRHRFTPGFHPQTTPMIYLPGLTEWSIVTTGSSTIELDFTRPGPFSEASVKLDRVSNGQTDLLTPTGTVPAIDLTRGPLVVWVYLPDPSPKGIFIQAGNNSANYFSWDRYGNTNPDVAVAHVDGWTAFELFPQGATLVGTPDPTTVNWFRVRPTGNDTTVYLGGMAQRTLPIDLSIAGQPPQVILRPGVTLGVTLGPGAEEDATRPGPGASVSYEIVPESGGGITLNGLDTSLDEIYATPFIVWAQFTEGMANPKGIIVQTGDTAWSNRRLHYLYGNHQGDLAYRRGNWRGFRLSAATPKADIGTPDVVNTIQVAAIATNGSDPVWLGGVQQITPPELLYPNGVLTVYFDDAYEDVYTHAMPILAKHGVQGVTCAIVASVGTPGFATVQQLREMQDRAGWEIAGHSWSPNGTEYRFDQFTPEELELEFRRLKTWMVANGFNSDTLVSPGGVFSRTIWETARRYFAFHRGVGSTVAQGAYSASPRCAYPARVLAPNFNAGGSVNLAMLADIIDGVRSARSWGHIAFHQVIDGASSGLSINKGELSDLIGYAVGQGVAIRTVRQIQDEANLA